jgi:hypothetical protein
MDDGSKRTRTRLHSKMRSTYCARRCMQPPFNASLTVDCTHIRQSLRCGLWGDDVGLLGKWRLSGSWLSTVSQVWHKHGYDASGSICIKCLVLRAGFSRSLAGTFKAFRCWQTFNSLPSFADHTMHCPKKTCHPLARQG